MEISRAVALRIALAAKVLPGIEVRQLLTVLGRRLGEDALTEQGLTKMTVTDLKTGLASLDGEEDGEDSGIGMEYLKLAVRYLWGEEGVEESLPATEAYAEGDMPESIRVAVASNGGEQLDGHFGSCPRFLVYQLNGDDIRLIAIRATDGASTAEDRNAFRADLIRDCHVLYIQSIGGPAAAKVVRSGIYPIKKPEGGTAREHLSDLQQVMRRQPPPWLAKVMGHGAEQRSRLSG